MTLPGATGGAGGAITYALTGDLPAGLVFDAGTRVLSGTPTAQTATGTFTLTATETGGTAQTATLGFDITVTAAPAALTARFNPLTYSVNEEGGSVDLAFELSAAAPAGGITVQFETRGGSGAGAAMAGDYTVLTAPASVVTIDRGCHHRCRNRDGDDHG